MMGETLTAVEGTSMDTDDSLVIFFQVAFSKLGLGCT